MPRVSNSKALNDLANTLSYLLVFIFGLFISLEILNLEKTVTSLLAGAGVLGLALGFAFQEIASNFVSGIFIALSKPYQVGDIVEVESYFGEVTRISLRTTSIMTFQGLEVLIPNKDMFTKAFINLTTTPTRRMDLAVGVSYGDDLDLVEEITKEALREVKEKVADKEVEVFFDEFGSSSINLKARVWVNYTANSAFVESKHQAIKAIKKAYDKNNITIPFPIRTLDFGIKGGKELADSLSKQTESPLSN